MFHSWNRGLYCYITDNYTFIKTSVILTSQCWLTLTTITAHYLVIL